MSQRAGLDSYFLSATAARDDSVVSVHGVQSFQAQVAFRASLLHALVAEVQRRLILNWTNAGKKCTFRMTKARRPRSGPLATGLLNAGLAY